MRCSPLVSADHALARVRRGILAAVAAGLAIVAVSPRGEAGTITWGSPQTIVGDTDVVATGSKIYAFNFGDGALVGSTTVNGVTFAPFAIPYPSPQPPKTVTVGNVTLTESPDDLYGYDGLGSTSTPYSNLSKRYKTLLQSAAYASAPGTITVTLGGLTPSQQYVVQWWASDSSLTYGSLITATGGNTVTLDSNTTNAYGGVGQYAIGTFTAAGTTEQFTLDGSVGSGVLGLPMISGLQLRTPGGPGPTPVPEIAAASAGTALSLVAAAFAAVERRRRRVTVVARRG